MAKMTTFDSFLESGGRTVVANSGPAVSIADIKHWRSIESSASMDETDEMVVARRTALWRMVLASYGRADDSAFAVPADPRLWLTLRRADRRTFEWGSIPPADVLYPRLSLLMDSSIPAQGQDLYSPFMIPIAPRSRASCYTLRPRTRVPHELPLQQVHISPYAIPAEQADIPCNTLTAPVLLDMLNDIFGTYVPYARAVDIMLRHIRTSVDLGMVYAQLRPWWPPAPVEPAVREYTMVPHVAPQVLLGYRGATEILQGARVPRRVWDLYSNRVVEFDSLWMLRAHNDIPENVWAVSHSWLAGAARQSIVTTVNGGQWPVPLPKETTLDHVRIELLNLGAEYVFLDVLCLRQAAGESMEHRRRKEWSDDVPYLGCAYRHTRYQTTVVYFSGLGLPFSLLQEELDSPFHWLNRSWTLQESVVNWLPGGLSNRIQGLSSGGPRFIARVREAVQVSTTYRPALEDLLDEFQRRPGYADKKQYDQVLALSYLLSKHSPTPYSEDYSSAEEAWDDVVASLDGTELLHLLACYSPSRRLDPEAVQRNLSPWGWWPTWNQMMLQANRAPAPTNPYAPQEYLRRATTTPRPRYAPGDEWLSHVGLVFKACRISRATGTLTVQPTGYYDESYLNRIKFRFVCLAEVDANTDFMLVGLAGLECWIVCRAGPERMLVVEGDAGGVQAMLELEKVTVGRMDEAEDRAHLAELAVRACLGRPRFVCYRYRSGDAELGLGIVPSVAIVVHSARRRRPRVQQPRTRRTLGVPVRYSSARVAGQAEGQASTVGEHLEDSDEWVDEDDDDDDDDDDEHW